MRRLMTMLAAALVATLALWAPAAQGAFVLEDLESAFLNEDESPAIEAGTHPFSLRTTFSINTIEDPVLGFEVPEEDFRDLEISVPPGVIADRDATPHCTLIEFLPPDGPIQCPLASTVGTVDVENTEPGNFETLPVFNLTPAPGTVARLGLVVADFVPVTIELGLSEEAPYHGVARLTNTVQALPFYSSQTELWGVPAASVHDADRGGPVDAQERPFLTLPRSCTGPLETTFTATSWQGSFFSDSVQTENEEGEPLGMRDCASLDFGPSISAQPTSHLPAAPSGLDFELQIDDPGLTNPTGTAESDIKKAVVTLPEGMTLNPSQAEGLGVCSEADLAEEALDAAPGEGCPQTSKVGSMEVETPILEDEVLRGSLYVAEPYENRFGSLIAIFLVIESPELGVMVKQAGKVEPDPATGQLTVTMDDLPQFPLGEVRIRLREGARSPLVTPGRCGSYEVKALFTPWANPEKPAPASAEFQIAGEPGNPCPPAGPLPFEPGFSAGTLSNGAGAHSPFLMRLTRRDGDQDLTKLSTTLPPGVLASLVGVGKCSDEAIAAARARTGQNGGHEELQSPSCPASSLIGHTLAGAGVGSQLTYVPGSLYLAGPYQGAPLSVVAIVAGVAGPFDVGTIVVRVALDFNPLTAQATADGSRSDPIPHILQGIPLVVRDIRVNVDRPEWTFNPTSCDPSSTQATIFGGFVNLFDPADDVPVSRETRFQAAGCAALGFKPSLKIRLKGPTERGGNPALRATYEPKPGHANLKRLSLTFPRSAFVDNANFRTICTRVQFAAGACPKGSIYGKVKAWTPLLEEPLEGPVYLRSSNNLLPDAVFALKGIIDVEVAVRIDSRDGRLRATVASAPDAPVSRVVVQMQGGRKGLFVNSRDLCDSPNRAQAKLLAHSGKRRNLKPTFGAAGCGGS